jgi:hypothetical protein
MAEWAAVPLDTFSIRKGRSSAIQYQWLVPNVVVSGTSFIQVIRTVLSVIVPKKGASSQNPHNFPTVGMKE